MRVQTASVLRDVLGASPFEDDHPATVPLRMIEEAGEGILLYVFPRGRASLVADFQAFAGGDPGRVPGPRRDGVRSAEPGSVHAMRLSPTSGSARRCWRTSGRARCAC